MKKNTRSILAGLALVPGIFMTSTLWAAGNESGFPKMELPGVIRGDELLTKHPDKVARLAKWYGKDDAAFRKMLSEEKSLRADRGGRLHYVCKGVVAGAGEAVGAAAVTQQSYPLSQTFELESLPGASRVIYLDFDGHTTSGTPWNSNFTAGANIVTPRYDTDGNATGFVDAELQKIQGIWKRVAEDFAAYQVNVTTKEPGTEALRKSPSTDGAFGVRVCIGGSSYDWYGAGAGGVAYVGSFTWDTDSPCFVFTAQLGNGAEKYTAEAVSHEVGHTLGLMHDGQTGVTEYYEGHDNWAPIMGVGYYREVTQWSDGQYAQANNLENDLQVMTGYGLSFRADEHGDDIASATALAGTAVSAAGIITAAADADLFRFTTGEGTVSFTAAPAVPSPNLDIQLAIYDGTGGLVGSSNPAGMAGTISTPLAAGTYYLAVEGVGTGLPTTGYNDYGSLGEYSVAGSVVATGNQAPVANVSATPVTGYAPLTVNFSSAGSYDPDGSIAAYDWDLGNGVTSAATSASTIYTTPGTYAASLVVTDNGGLTGAGAVTITVQQAPVTPKVRVASITMSYATSRKGKTAQATVRVVDGTGKVVSGATVNGAWSGLASKTASAVTSRKGDAVVKAPTVTASGVMTFTVTGITASGLTYDASLNGETSDSITLP